MSIEKIILSGNCYWCVEAMYQEIKGCIFIKPGFFQFKEVFSGKVEAIELFFDNEIISFEGILNVFYLSHNPTLINWNPEECIFPLNRSCIIYNQDNQKDQSEFFIEVMQHCFNEKINTKVLNENCGQFTVLEESGWNYYINNPKDGYCASIIKPKLKKLHEIVPHLINNFK